MKPTKTLALISGLGMLASVALAQPAPGDDPSPQPRPDRPGAGRPDPEMRRKMLLEKYDANNDGKLDDTEHAAIGKDIEEGKFGPPQGLVRRGPQGPNRPDAPDFAPRARRSQPGPEPREFGREVPDAPPGEGLPRVAPRAPREQAFARREGGEAAPFAPRPREGMRPNSDEPRRGLEERRREFIKKYDADGDGKLSPSEREAIGRDIEEGKIPPPLLAPLQPPREPLPPREPQPPREPHQPRPSE